MYVKTTLRKWLFAQSSVVCKKWSRSRPQLRNFLFLDWMAGRSIRKISIGIHAISNPRSTRRILSISIFVWKYKVLPVTETYFKRTSNNNNTIVFTHRCKCIVTTLGGEFLPHTTGHGIKSKDSVCFKRTFSPLDYIRNSSATERGIMNNFASRKWDFMHNTIAHIDNYSFILFDICYRWPISSHDRRLYGTWLG